MKNIFSSPKTTWAALLALISLLATQFGYLLDADPATVFDFQVVIPQFIAFVGLIFARDNNKTSEDVEAVEPPKIPETPKP